MNEYDNNKDNDNDNYLNDLSDTLNPYELESIGVRIVCRTYGGCYPSHRDLMYLINRLDSYRYHHYCHYLDSYILQNS